MIVEGQVHGGIAQGVGQALCEGAVYDKDGQLVTGSFMDYAMPRADYLPSLKVGTTMTKCPSNPLGIKGCGEAGAIAAPAAVINAITDAHRHRRFRHAGDAADRVGGAYRRSGRAAPRRREAKIDNGELQCTTSTSIVRRRCGRRPTCSARIADAKLLAGGQTLLPTMKLRLAKPPQLIDLARDRGADRHRAEGPLDRHRRDDAPCRCARTRRWCRSASPVLAELAGMIGDPAVRQCGTIGGSLANNDPNADYPAACLGLGATIITNKRRIAADDFFKGMFETALEPDEIITKVSFPLPKKAAYQKFRNRPRALRWSACSSAKRGSESASR